MSKIKSDLLERSAITDTKVSVWLCVCVKMLNNQY